MILSIHYVTSASSPSVQLHATSYHESSRSINAASLTQYVLIQHFVSSSTTGMQPSSSMSQLQPTPFIEAHKEIISSTESLDSSNTPSQPTQAVTTVVAELLQSQTKDSAPIPSPSSVSQIHFAEAQLHSSDFISTTLIIDTPATSER